MSAAPTGLTRLDPSRLTLPDKPALEGLEAKWMRRWEEDEVYRFEGIVKEMEFCLIETCSAVLEQATYTKK